uniref:Gallid herpesvirus antisense RNA n=1 Tax=Infectious laryngotracheitis virus TaxID=10386 RepID=Q69291_ILTV|nr:orf2 [Gallid alphaherpesvirus 1]
MSDVSERGGLGRQSVDGLFQSGTGRGGNMGCPSSSILALQRSCWNRRRAANVTAARQSHKALYRGRTRFSMAGPYAGNPNSTIAIERLLDHKGIGNFGVQRCSPDSLPSPVCILFLFLSSTLASRMAAESAGGSVVDGCGISKVTSQPGI